MQVRLGRSTSMEVVHILRHLQVVLRVETHQPVGDPLVDVLGAAPAQAPAEATGVLLAELISEVTYELAQRGAEVHHEHLAEQVLHPVGHRSACQDHPSLELGERLAQRLEALRLGVLELG